MKDLQAKKKEGWKASLRILAKANVLTDNVGGCTLYRDFELERFIESLLEAQEKRLQSKHRKEIISKYKEFAITSEKVANAQNTRMKDAIDEAYQQGRNEAGETISRFESGREVKDTNRRRKGELYSKYGIK